MSSIDSYLKQAKELSAVTGQSETWLIDNRETRARLNSVLVGFDEIPAAIPVFFGVGGKLTQVPPWHQLFFEAIQDLDSALLLLLMGFYKDSHRSLRSFIELHTFGVHQSMSEDEKYFRDWLQGEVRTPQFYNMINAVSKKSIRIQAINEKFNWSVELISLYKKLFGFIHTRGAFHTHTFLRHSNVTSFSELGMRSGVDSLLMAVRLVGMGFAVSFPMSFHPLPLFEKFAFSQPCGGFLDEGQVERVRRIFPNTVSQELERICLADDEAQSLAAGVTSMPDLSEEQVVHLYYWL